MGGFWWQPVGEDLHSVDGAAHQGPVPGGDDAVQALTVGMQMQLEGHSGLECYSYILSGPAGDQPDGPASDLQGNGLGSSDALSCSLGQLGRGEGYTDAVVFYQKVTASGSSQQVSRVVQQFSQHVLGSPSVQVMNQSMSSAVCW